mmetsp:Transcript_18843/g.28661  ORF Transcript_18843/g.28661 Transcript_18843/m.28661 type:complete len:173 (+) Transcript_18843:248-766(+)
MYTNSDTAHAIPTIHDFLLHSSIVDSIRHTINIPPIMKALQFVWKPDLRVRRSDDNKSFPGSRHPNRSLQNHLPNLPASSSKKIAAANIQSLFLRLRRRGYTTDTLHPCFMRAIQPHHLKETKKVQQPAENEIPDVQPHQCYQHLLFHPGDPSSKCIQRVFHETISKHRDFF